MAGDGGRQDAAGPWACVGAGALLATAGLRRRSWRGLALALAGGGLAYYGLRRVCRMPGAHCDETVRLVLEMIGAGVNSGMWAESGTYGLKSGSGPLPLVVIGTGLPGGEGAGERVGASLATGRGDCKGRPGISGREK